MIGWRVTSASASGWRRMWSRPRRATTQMSEIGLARRWEAAGTAWGRRCSSGDLRGLLLGVGDRGAGEGEEDVVEGGLAQADVLDLDPVVGERLGQLRRRPAGRPRWAPARCARRRRRRAGRRRRRAMWSTTSSTRERVDDRGEHLRAADLALEGARRRRARSRCRGRPRRCRRRGGRPPRGTGWSGGSSRPRPPGSRGRPTARCGRAGRGRWWARRGTGPRAGRRAWPPGRAGGACRRSRSSPAARRRRRA